MTLRTFDAFALPADLAAEELALSGEQDSGVHVRYVDASPTWLAGVCDALGAAGEALGSRSARDLARVLGQTGSRFSDPGDPIRAEAVALLPATSGLSPEMATAVLDGMAADWTAERLSGLLSAELGGTQVLDGFVDVEAPAVAGRLGDQVMAVGPSLCAQVVAGSVPGVGVTALLRSLLVKAPTLLKPGRGDVVLPVLFARALREADPALADALAVVYWPGGERELERAVLSRADLVVAYGSDETVGDLRALTPVTSRFVPYHHRVSIGVVGRDALTTEAREATAMEVAEAVALFDQRGCVSPQVLFVEGSPEAVAAFAASLAEELRRLEARLPSGRLAHAEASALHQLRGTAELMSAEGVQVFHGGDGPWTVLLEPGDASAGGGAGRTVRLRQVEDVVAVTRSLSRLGPNLQTVGVAGLQGRLEELARAWGRFGVSRVVPFSRVAFPPPWWHHDGRGPIRDLVRWVDLEGA